MSQRIPGETMLFAATRSYAVGSSAFLAT